MVVTWCRLCIIVVILILSSTPSTFLVGSTSSSVLPPADRSVDDGAVSSSTSVHLGRELFQRGVSLLEAQEYESAIPILWRSILLYQDPSPAGVSVAEQGEAWSSIPPYTVQNAFLLFLQCFAQQGRLVEGYIYVAREYIQRGQLMQAKAYLDRALEVDPSHSELPPLLQRVMAPSSSSVSSSTLTPEQLHDIGVQYFNKKQFDRAAQFFEQSCRESNEQIGPACANAVFCRTEILDWGTNGSQFDLDMDRVQRLTQDELLAYREDGSNTAASWRRCTSVHPHMMLGYPVDAKFQRIVDEAYAATDELHARVQIDEQTQKAYVLPLPPDLPYNYPQEFRDEILKEQMELLHTSTTAQQHQSTKDSFRIRIGFVSSAIKQTAVMYLGHAILQYLNRTKFEVHVFATSGPDHPVFIERTTNGIDWRQRVMDNVDYFHDVSHLQRNHIELARFIRQHKIHILIDWDGYARQGLRPQGLFALRPAPIQIFHQEFLGTSGATYVDYHISDIHTSPPEKDYLYTEKLIYLPNHFFSKGHAVMPEIAPPRIKYDKRTIPYKTGTGSPQENRCLSPASTNNTYSDTDVSFVFCNFHKFLKFNPQTMRSWLTILKSVPNSILCLLENPPMGVPNLRRFVNDINPALNERIHFLEWEDNLLDHQARNRDLCNAVLDTWPYNGHTTTMDALYAGVPVVTRSDGDHMAARVTTSSNIILGIPQLNGKSVPEYENIAIKLATNLTFYTSIREHLIDTCLQVEPMHPFWDVQQYTKDLEYGLEAAFNLFVSANEPAHIFVGKTADTCVDHRLQENCGKTT